MFSTTQLLINFKTGQSSPQFDFNSLLSHMGDDKKLLIELASISEDDINVQRLLAAIKEGDADASVFNEPHCDLYLLHLLQQKKIDFWPAITVYVYLMALAQFTHRQSLKLEDENNPKLKTLAPMSMFYLTEQNNLSREGKTYFLTVIAHLKTLGYLISLDTVKTFALSLPPVEQWLIKVDFDTKNHNDVTKALFESLPFMAATDATGDFFYIPSLSVVNFLLDKIAPTRIQLHPLFNTLTSDEVIDLHLNYQHPGALYSKWATSSLIYLHSENCGPIFAWLHDIAHTLWSNLLDYSDRETLYKIFIPQLKQWQQDHKYSTLSTRLDQIIRRAYDFDLTPLTNYKDPTMRFAAYITSIFRKSSRSKGSIYQLAFGRESILKEEEQIGEHVDDELYFLIRYKFHESTKYPLKENSAFWHKVGTWIEAELNNRFRNPNATKLLDILAQNAVNSEGRLFTNPNANIDHVKKVNWQKLIEALQGSFDVSRALWRQCLSDTLFASLKTLITEFGMNFFDPLRSLTKEEMKGFLKFAIEKKRELDVYLENKELHSLRLQTLTC